jgi:hypothetical protein
MEPIQDDIETVRNWLDLAEWSDAAEDFTGGVKAEALAALDRLVAERDAARFVNGEDIPSVRTRSELYAALKAEEFKSREWKDKAQDKIAECEELVAERDLLREDRDRADNAYMHNLSRLADLADERDRLIRDKTEIKDALEYLRSGESLELERLRSGIGALVEWLRGWDREEADVIQRLEALTKAEERIGE